MKTRKIMETAIFMVMGALILTSGVFIGARVTHAQNSTFHAGTVSDEEILHAKSQIIDKVVKVDDSIENKFVASRKANELANFDLEKLQELTNKGVTIIIVPNTDVYESVNPTRAEENKRNGVVTDAIYIEGQNQVLVSLQAPTGVLSNQISNIVK